MVVLNWKEEDLELKAGEGILEIKLTPLQCEALLKNAADAFHQDSEIKIELPQKWTVYLKVKKQSSIPTKMTMSKPELGVFVGSIIFNAEHASEFLNFKNLLSSSEKIAVSKISKGPKSSVNNFEFILGAKWK